MHTPTRKIHRHTCIYKPETHRQTYTYTTRNQRHKYTQQRYTGALIQHRIGRSTHKKHKIETERTTERRADIQYIKRSPPNVLVSGEDRWRWHTFKRERERG